VRTYSNKTRFSFITAVRDIVVRSKGIRSVCRAMSISGLQFFGSKGAAPAAPRVSEWARLQSNDFPLIMLWYEPVDEPEYDEDGERTVKEPLIEASAIAVHLKSRLFGITHLFENRV
jgi:hypothetical protein